VPPSAAAREVGLTLGVAVGALRFHDANGENVIVLRTVDTPQHGRWVMADDVVVHRGKQQVLRSVRDGYQGCDFDVTAEFVAGTLTVRDVDGDGIGEVSFAYRIACRNDPSPAEQKLVMLQDGRKYILRGLARNPYVPYRAPVPQPDAADWPAGTYDTAMHQFDAIPREF
jgi:hypothetical protein